MVSARCVLLATLTATGGNAEQGQELPYCDKIYESPQDHLVCFPDKQISMCSESHTSTAEAIEDCEQICGENIALTVGTFEQGVDKTFMNMVCLGEDTLQTGVEVLKRDDNLRRRCMDLGTSFGKLQKFTGDFVAKFELVKFAQENYAQIAKNNTMEMQAEIAKRIDKDMAEARPEEKIPLLKEIIKLAMADYMPDISDQNEVKEAVQDVIYSGTILVEHLIKQMANIRTFQEDCLNVMNIPISSQEAQMVDLCATNANYCWDAAALNSTEYLDKARHSIKHVGCCCAGIPSVFGTAEAPGKGLSSNCDPYGRRLSSKGETRRLKDKKDDETMDACLYAKQEILRSARTTRIEMRSKGLDTSGIDAMTTKISTCDDGRRMEQAQEKTTTSMPSGTGRQLVEKSNDVVCIAKPDRPMAAHWDDDDQEELPLTVTYQKTEGVCSELTLPTMTDMCNNFCGVNSIAFLLGTPSHGFSHKEADAVCMAPGGTEMTPGLTNKCLKAASNMKAHSFVASELVTALEQVKAAKLVVEGHAQNEAKELNDWIKEEAAYEFLHMNVGEDEGELLRKFADRTNGIGAGQLNQFDLDSAIDWVLEKGTQLELTLVKMKEETEEFLRECAVLTTGYDATKKYMLDLCRVSGDKCLDQENAVRAVCCCGYSPLTSYGTAPSLAATIPGESRRLHESEELPSATSPGDSRRLQESEELPSVCDMAQDGIDETWGHASETLTRLNRQQLITREETKAKHTYDLCPADQEDSSLSPIADLAQTTTHVDTTQSEDGATQADFNDTKSSGSAAITAFSSAVAGCLLGALP